MKMAVKLEVVLRRGNEGSGKQASLGNGYIMEKKRMKAYVFSVLQVVMNAACGVWEECPTHPQWRLSCASLASHCSVAVGTRHSPRPRGLSRPTSPATCRTTSLQPTCKCHVILCGLMFWEMLIQDFVQRACEMSSSNRNGSVYNKYLRVTHNDNHSAVKDQNWSVTRTPEPPDAYTLSLSMIIHKMNIFSIFIFFSFSLFFSVLSISSTLSMALPAFSFSTALHCWPKAFTQPAWQSKRLASSGARCAAAVSVRR